MSIHLISLFLLMFFGIGCTQDPQTMKQIKDCLAQDGAVVCLKERVVEVLNETIVSDHPVTLYGVFDIVKDPMFVPSQDDEFLPRDLTKRNEKLNELLYKKIEEFFESRSVKVNLGHMIEARGKKDKKGGMLMMGGLAMAGMMAQMFMGKIAFMAGAALLVAKLALLLSTVIGFKKLSGGGGGGRDFKTNMLLMGGMTMAGAVTQLVMAKVGFIAGAVSILVKSVFLVLVSKRFDIKDFIMKGHGHKEKHKHKRKKKKKPHKDKDHHKDKDKDHHKDKDKDHHKDKDKDKDHHQHHHTHDKDKDKEKDKCKCKDKDKDKDHGHKDKDKKKKKKKKKDKNDKDHIQLSDDEDDGGHFHHKDQNSGNNSSHEYDYHKVEHSGIFSNYETDYKPLAQHYEEIYNTKYKYTYK